jgi:F-type H+-transporting ATPase subunit epsilon
MNLEIITPEKKVYSGEVDLINLPGSDGSFGILNDHAPLVSTLKEGEIKIVEKDNSEKLFPIKGGVIEVNNNNIIVLAE